MDNDLSKRILMSLVNDVEVLQEQTARIHVQIAALAKKHGVKMPAPNMV